MTAPDPLRTSIAAELGSLADAARAVAAPEATALPAGVVIGAHFELEGVLGRGGMGVVLRAHRVEGGFSQRGAIKCLHAELTGPGVAARFLREREVLARLEHPNIARLIDGGLLDTRGDEWHWRGDSAALEQLPPTLAGVDRKSVV